jgi:hypothetical protein
MNLKIFRDRIYVRVFIGWVYVRVVSVYIALCNSKKKRSKIASECGHVQPYQGVEAKLATFYIYSQDKGQKRPSSPVFRGPTNVPQLD